MTLGDRVAVMRDGFLQQVGSPSDLYDRPVNLFVAEFIGSPAMNLVGADIAAENGRFEAAVRRQPAAGSSDRPALAQFAGPAGHPRRAPGGSRGRGRRPVAARAARSRRSWTSARTSAPSVLVHFGVGAPAVRGEDVQAALGADAVAATSDETRRKGSLFTARVARESRAREGEPIELAVETSRLHFFEIESGNAI